VWVLAQPGSWEDGGYGAREGGDKVVEWRGYLRVAAAG